LYRTETEVKGKIKSLHEPTEQYRKNPVLITVGDVLKSDTRGMIPEKSFFQGLRKYNIKLKNKMFVSLAIMADGSMYR
jgi:siroheme synthase